MYFQYVFAEFKPMADLIIVQDANKITSSQVSNIQIFIVL
jgi:hypothetical protein